MLIVYINCLLPRHYTALTPPRRAPEYGFLPPTRRARAMIAKSGTMFIAQRRAIRALRSLRHNPRRARRSAAVLASPGVITTDSPQHSVSVAAVITDDHGRALLVQRRDDHHWEPPGGVLELEEAIEDGLRREVREEAGLDVEPEQLTGVYKNMARGVVALVFRCKVTGGELTASDETEDFRWAAENEIRELATEAYAVRVLDALSPGTAPAIRQHDGVHLI